MDNVRNIINDLWSAINKFEEIYGFENEFPHMVNAVMIGLLYELELPNSGHNVNRLKSLIYDGLLAEEIIEILK